MRVKLYLISAPLFFVFSTFLLYGADTDSVKSDSDRHFLINMGIGKCYFGPAISIDLTYACNDKLFIFRIIRADEFKFGSEAVYDSPDIYIREYGLLYGWQIRQNALSISLAGGIGYLNGVDRGKLIGGKIHEQINISTISFPIEAKLQLDVSKYFGFGCACFANVNKDKSFIGGLINIHLILPI